MDRTNQLLGTLQPVFHGYDAERTKDGRYRVYLIVADETVAVVETEAEAQRIKSAKNHELRGRR